MLVHEPLHGLFEAVLAQARAALVEMHPDLREPGLLDLAVEVAVDARPAPRYTAPREACRSSSRVLPGFGTRR